MRDTSVTRNPGPDGHSPECPSAVLGRRATEGAIEGPCDEASRAASAPIPRGPVVLASGPMRPRGLRLARCLAELSGVGRTVGGRHPMGRRHRSPSRAARSRALLTILLSAVLLLSSLGIAQCVGWGCGQGQPRCVGLGCGGRPHCVGMGCSGETPRAGGVEGCMWTGCRNNRAPQPPGQGDPTSSGSGGAADDPRSQPASSAQSPADGQESADDRDEWSRTLGSVPGGSDSSEGWNGRRSEETPGG